MLVVDDDPAILELIEHQLRRKGHRVVAVGSPEAAVTAVEERGAPEVAVLDVSMPGRTGFDLLADLRRREGCAELPAVFLSARVQPEDIATGEALGAVYLTKPYVANALLTAIERVLTQDDAGSW